MSKAVQFDEYGDIDVLAVREVARPNAADGQVLVEVKVQNAYRTLEERHTRGEVVLRP